MVYIIKTAKQRTAVWRRSGADDMDEKGLVGKLFASLPVLRDSLPPDITRLVEMLRKAFLSRGLSRASRSQILAAIEALSKFEVGLITTEELALCIEPKEVHASVSTVAEVIGLARQLSTLSERAAKAASPTAQSPGLSSPKALGAPSLSIISPRPLTLEWTSLEGSDYLMPVPRTPPPSTDDLQSPAWTPEESNSSKVMVIPDSTFCNSSNFNSQFEVLKTTSETDASFRPVTPDRTPFREAEQERAEHQEPAARTPSPDNSRDSSDLPVSPTDSSESEVPSVPSDFIRPVTPPFNGGSNVSWEPVPMTPPLSPEKPQPLASSCTPKRKEGSEIAALPTTPVSSPSSSSSSCSNTASVNEEIMIQMHVPGYKYGKLLGTGGTNIKRIQALTGAKLFLAREYGSLEIRGTNKQCLEARILAKQLVNEVDQLRGTLCHLPCDLPGHSWLEDIAKKNSCKIEPLVGAYNQRNFAFVCGSLKSDIECCCSDIEEWVKEFSHAITPQIEPGSFRNLRAEPCRSRNLRVEPYRSRNLRVEPCSSRNLRVEPCSSRNLRVEPCSSRNLRVEPCRSRNLLVEPCSSLMPPKRIQYTREQLMSCGAAELELEFLPGTQELGILSEVRSPASEGSSTSTISWNHTELWNVDRCMPDSVWPDSHQTSKKTSREAKWEHDLFEDF